MTFSSYHRPAAVTTERIDLRLAPIALGAWVACAVAVDVAPGRALLAAAALGLVVVALALFPVRSVPSALTAALLAGLGMGCAGLAVTALRAEAVQTGPLAELADHRAQVVLVGTLVTDPMPRSGTFGDYVVARIRAEAVHGRGTTTQIRAPVLVIGEDSFGGVQFGDTLRIEGRLASTQDTDLSAVLTSRREPKVVEPAAWWHLGIARVREGIRVAHEPLADGPRALVPALVDGDDLEMPVELEEAFRTAGLTHLLAVSGSNLTLVLGFVMLVSRWCGVRGRGFVVVGIASVIFFVLLARPEPSVLRAAAMGVVALAGLSAGGRRRGVRALCIAVVTLVLVDPWLARSPGFALSTLATAGILLFAGPWRDAMAVWMPRGLAEAVAVPLSAQLMCTPVVAALSGQVSLVAVASNLLAAPAVGPATVLGLVSGLIAVAVEPLGQIGGRLAGLPAWWIVSVAEHSAQLQGASTPWGTELGALAALVVACLVAIAVLPMLLRRRWMCVLLTAICAVLVVRPVGRTDWPPPRWLAVMCDVGQGDGLVLRAAPRAAVVVDAGPDPRAMDRCLDRLGVEQVPLVVLTHFHADHVDGLPGVFDGRVVGEVEVSPLAEPIDQAAAAAAIAAAAKAPVVVGTAGERRTIGTIGLEFLGPRRLVAGEPNNASLVVAAKIAGHRFLLTGDAEPEEQGDLLRAAVDLDTDVLKVPHHGSANVDPDFLAAAHPVVAIVSAGVDNTYGHPSPHLLGLLNRQGVRVFRTDRDGAIAIVEHDGRLGVVTER